MSKVNIPYHYDDCQEPASRLKMNQEAIEENGRNTLAVSQIGESEAVASTPTSLQIQHTAMVRINLADAKSRHPVSGDIWCPQRFDVELGFSTQTQFYETEGTDTCCAAQPNRERHVFFDGNTASFEPQKSSSDAPSTIDITQSLRPITPSAIYASVTSPRFVTRRPQRSNSFQLEHQKDASLYRKDARSQLLSAWNGEHGFRDPHGFIVGYSTDGSIGSPGEATLHTAIAAIAIAAANYHQNSWEDANARLYDLLKTLFERSWGNVDNSGEAHPIRHPDVFDFDADGTKFRNSPLTKDSFGAVLCACYYAYASPNTSLLVRDQAKQLLQKWVDYLARHQYRLHSSYIVGEFEKDGKNYANIFSGPNRETKSYKGLEAFVLGSISFFGKLISSKSLVFQRFAVRLRF